MVVLPSGVEIDRGVREEFSINNGATSEGCLKKIKAKETMINRGISLVTQFLNLRFNFNRHVNGIVVLFECE